MKTITNQDIPEETRGIVYFCVLNVEHETLEVLRAVLFAEAFDALQAYANTPNPESQMATGGTYEELLENLEILHQNMHDQEWIKRLIECV